jgi:hypothetical protein
MKRVVDAVLALLHLDLGRAADLDHGNAAGELGQPLLQLLAVIVGRGVSICWRIASVRALIASWLPAPSTIVVLSLSIVTRLAVRASPW